MDIVLMALVGSIVLLVLLICAVIVWFLWAGIRADKDYQARKAIHEEEFQRVKKNIDEARKKMVH